MLAMEWNEWRQEMNQYLINFKTWFNQYTSGQKLYMTALLVFVFFLFSEEGDYFLFKLSGVIALFAMAVDIWPGFIRVWNTFLGRIIILVTYAVVANIAIAASYQKLNEVVGIDPSPLFYSIGFVTLLMAPIFILTITLLVMLGVWTWQQSVLLINLLLALFRLKSLKLNSKIKHPTRTALLKLFLIVPMFGAVISGYEIYGDNLHIAGVSVGVTCTDSDGNKVDCPEDGPNSFSEVAEVVGKELKKGFNPENPEDVVQLENNIKSLEQNKVNKELPGDRFNMSTLVGGFVYEMELYSNIQCIMAPEEKAMFIGEYDIFVAKRNKHSPSGYDFYVRNCVAKQY